MKINFLLFALLSLAACSDSATTATQQPPAKVAPPVTVPPHDAPPAAKTGGFDAARAWQHAVKSMSFGPHPPGSEANRRVREYIVAELRSYGCTVAEDTFTAPTPVGDIQMTNVLGKQPGEKRDILLVMSHYDSKRLDGFIGASDPGSSIGVVLELARHLCPQQTRHAIWFAFTDGEEALLEEWSEKDSVYGSRQMAAQMAMSGDLKRIKALLLADLVGDKHLTIRRETLSTPWLIDLVWRTAKRLGYEKYFLDEELPVQDDHIPFITRGVPAVDIIDIEYAHWHKTTDTLENISARSMGIVGHVMLEVIAELDKKARK